MTLDRTKFEPVMACDPRYERFAASGPWQTLRLDSVSSHQFAAALAKGSPLYDAPTLRRYVKQDLEHIEQVKPDVIVGDFRLSLSVSARLVGIPYIGVVNAYWSPYYSVDRFPLPVLPITRHLPLPLAAALFRLAQPAAFRLHCLPLNRARRENGLPSLGRDLRRVYADADHVAYPDIQQLFPIERLPLNHGYLGPILWSPPVPKPAWWEDLPAARPIVYVTMGSSGQSSVLAMVLRGLESLPVTVIASTADAATPSERHANSYIAGYLPGSEAAARSDLVICNGGSLTCQQALATGVPVIGIASNMDQFLNMDALVRAGVGLTLRADRIDPQRIGQVAEKALGAGLLARRASALAARLPARSLGECFATILRSAVER
jgi:UDP:flavonoid glycosyltransferase YjiC (YdhE family)